MVAGIGILLVIALFGWWRFSRPERGKTGSVSTNFRCLGPNDKILVDGFNGPKVQGVACHISRVQTGGERRHGRGGGYERRQDRLPADRPDQDSRRIQGRRA